MPQDPESHWATRGIIAWLRVPRFAKWVAVSGAVSMVVGIALSFAAIGGLFGYRKIQPRVLQGSVSGCAVSTPNVPDGPDPWGGCWPGASNTGVPTGTSLTEWGTSGEILFSTNNQVIDSKILRGFVNVTGTNVTIQNSQIYGVVNVLDSAPSASLTIEHTTINSKDDVAPYDFADYASLSGFNLTARYNELTGTRQGGQCNTCTAEHNWSHDKWIPPDTLYHMSAWRNDHDDTIRHNTLSCDFDPTGMDPEAGCSADMSGYPDFFPVENDTIDRNLFVANEFAAYCAYGGSTAGKTYSGLTNDIHFTDNVWQKGVTGQCADFGPITDFDPAAPGAVWTGNRWDDGSTIPTPTFP